MGKLVQRAIAATGGGLAMAVLWANVAVAETSARWLQAAPLAELPASIRPELVSALDAEIIDVATCAEFLYARAELRPSLVDSLCDYVAFELATLRDTLVAKPGRLRAMQNQLLELGVARDVGRWREFVAIQSGWLQRLSGHALKSGVPPHQALRPWQIMRALDRGDVEGARQQQALLGAPSCPRACAHAALVALAQGMLAFHEANRDQAIELAERAAKLLVQARPREPHLVALLAPEVAVLLDELARNTRRDEILDLGQQAALEVLPERHAARRHLGVTRMTLLANQGQTEAASQLHDALLAKYGESLAGYPFTAARLRLGQGVKRYMQADYDGAALAATRARQTTLDTLGAAAPMIAEALNIIGLAQGTRDRNEQAIASYREALGLRQAIFATGHPLLAELNNNLSVVFHNMGRYDLAESFSQRSLRADRAFYGPDHEEVASDLYNLAAVYRAMGEPLRAIELLREAIRINTVRLGERHRRTAIMHLGLGRAYMEQQDYAAALASFETSVRLHKARDPAGRDVPIARHQVAAAALALGDYERALRTLKEVLTRYEAIYGASHRHVAAAYRDLAEAQHELGDVAAADSSLMTSLVALASSEALEVRWRSWFALARHERAADHPDAAIFFAKMALDTLQTLRATQRSLGRRLQRAFARRRADTYRDTAVWLAAADRLLEAQRVLEMLKDEEYFDFTRRSTAGDRQIVFSSTEQAARDRLAAVQAALQSGAASAADYRKQLNAERLHLARPRPVPTESAAGWSVALAPGHMALYFVVSETTTQVIGATSHRSWRHEVDLGRADMAVRVLALREALATPTGDPLPASRALYDDLLRPLLDRAADATEPVRHLHVYLDDALRYLPLAALHDGERFLMERYTLARATVAPVPVSAASRPMRVAAFATSRAVAGFPALPATLTEVDAIVRRGDEDVEGAFPGGIWADDDFDRSALFDSLQSNFDRVHVASHFQFVPGNERESFLLLGDGEKLSLQDLRNAELSLAGLNLLALSGCETALGVAGADGREMDGFAQTAQRRGARNVVATLWAVEDAATATFMTAFYQAQSEGDDAVTALRKTQRRFGDRHPYFWAPFVVWAPLTAN